MPAIWSARTPTLWLSAKMNPLLPNDLDYAAVAGLSTECRFKLGAIRPLTLGQAARIEGMTPAALTLVLAHVKARARRHAAGL
jgi:tRNA uridine 5-carboxymethylaminomethyl modification enzyme